MEKRKVRQGSTANNRVAPPLVRVSQILWFEYLLEEEVVSNELVLSILIHTLERIELACEVSLESLKSLSNGGHNLKSLSLGKSGTKREVGEVSANSDSSGDDHGSLILGKGRGDELLMLCEES